MKSGTEREYKRLLLMLEIGLLLSGPCTTSSSTICYFPSPIDIFFHNTLFSFPCRHLIPQCVTLTLKGKGPCVLTLRLIYLLNFIFMFELKSFWRIQFIILCWNYYFFANLHHYLRILLFKKYIYFLNIVYWKIISILRKLCPILDFHMEKL